MLNGILRNVTRKSFLMSTGAAIATPPQLFSDSDSPEFAKSLIRGVQSAGTILTSTTEPANFRPFWIELRFGMEFLSRGALPVTQASRKTQLIWLLKSSQADAQFVVDGRYGGDVVSDAFDALTGRKLERFSSKNVQVSEQSPLPDDGNRAPVHYDANSAAPLRELPELIEVIADEQRAADRFRGVVTATCLMPYDEYQAASGSTSWNFTISPHRLLFVVKAHYPTGYANAHVGAYARAETIRLVDAITRTPLQLRIIGKTLPGTLRGPIHQSEHYL